MNAISAFQAGLTDEVGALAHASRAPAGTSLAAKTNAFVEAAEYSALSTNALDVWVDGLVPQTARMKR